MFLKQNRTERKMDIPDKLEHNATVTIIGSSPTPYQCFVNTDFIITHCKPVSQALLYKDIRELKKKYPKMQITFNESAIDRIKKINPDTELLIDLFDCNSES